MVKHENNFTKVREILFGIIQGVKESQKFTKDIVF